MKLLTYFSFHSPASTVIFPWPYDFVFLFWTGLIYSKFFQIHSDVPSDILSRALQVLTVDEYQAMSA